MKDFADMTEKERASFWGKPLKIYEYCLEKLKSVVKKTELDIMSHYVSASLCSLGSLDYAKKIASKEGGIEELAFKIFKFRQQQNREPNIKLENFEYETSVALYGIKICPNKENHSGIQHPNRCLFCGGFETNF